MRKPHYKPRRASGAQVGKIAKRVYVCAGCQLWHQAKPIQCIKCGRMDFLNFDSTGEAKRWATLLLSEKAGKISNLERQVRFPLMAAGPKGPSKVGDYIADFVYVDEFGDQVREDFKGAVTDVADFKLRFMKAQGLPVKLIIQGIHTHG